jgi:hypothetical protein
MLDQSWNWKKIAKRTGLSVLVLIVVSIGIAFAWVAMNRDEIQEKIAKALNEQFGLEVKMDRVQLSVFGNWPHTLLACEMWNSAAVFTRVPENHF